MSLKRREQDAIRDLVIKLSGYTDVDGAGCDSGDPLEFTLTEISQGFTYIENRLYDAINAARPGFDWPADRSAVDVAIDIIGGKYEESGSVETAGQVVCAAPVRDVQAVEPQDGRPLS